MTPVAVSRQQRQPCMILLLNVIIRLTTAREVRKRTVHQEDKRQTLKQLTPNSDKRWYCAEFFLEFSVSISNCILWVFYQLVNGLESFSQFLQTWLFISWENLYSSHEMMK